MQRTNRDAVPAERRQRLDAIGFIWNSLEEAWEEGFAALSSFKTREGHCNVPKTHVEGTFKLGQWVGVQRITEDTIPAERKQRLDAIGFIWNTLEEGWEEGFTALTTFKAREGHCRVPWLHVEGTFKLGTWVMAQRAKKDTMPAERRQRLDANGFVWDPFQSLWEEGFAALMTFKAREGHCRVPALHIEGTFKLGGWVKNQRKNKDTMSAERRQRLDPIGFVWGETISSMASLRKRAWEDGFRVLTEFKEREGHCRVPRLFVEGTYKLGQWVSEQRATEDTMPAERKRRLDAIGFVWDTLESTWEEGFAALTTFKTREGHCLVPLSRVEGRFKLGTWVGRQRENKDTMSADRRQRLDAIGFVWDPHESAWEKGFSALTTFNAREGHCLVPLSHVEGTFRLGQWVNVLRTNRDKMAPERKQRLEAIGFVWLALESAWEEGFAALTTFKAREGHCLVPRIHIEERFKLGMWVGVQRRERNTMPAERKRRLDAIGFVWHEIESRWERGFAALTTFKAREGHCRVPALHIENTFKLGTWVGNQRRDKDTMPAERKRRLDAIGFVWDARESAWEEGFAALRTFKAREGRCRVPALHIEGTFKLGGWVTEQRLRSDTLPPERRQRLDAIGFVWDARESAWEEGFAALMTFKAREGHCRVPALHTEGTFKLGGWVRKQRLRSDIMSASRRQQLNAIGFVWDEIESRWEKGFAALSVFKAREGHCLVPLSHIEGTFKLGQWVNVQRTNRDKMPPERKQRLNEIGFVWRVK